MQSGLLNLGITTRFGLLAELLYLGYRTLHVLLAGISELVEQALAHVVLALLADGETNVVKV